MPIYDLGVLPDGRAFYTMKVIEGRTLADLVEALHAVSTPDSWGVPPDGTDFLAIIEAFVAVCEAVAFAHDRGVVHRDLKPPNIMLGTFGEVLVVDWGLVKILASDAEADAESVSTTLSESPELGTRYGAVSGTRGYMAPEQARGQIDQIGPHTDVYALGAILWVVLIGRSPESGLAPPRAPDELVRICHEALAPDPASRPRDAGQLARRVGAWMRGAQHAARVEAKARAVDAALGALSPEDRHRARLWCLLAVTPDGNLRTVPVAPEHAAEVVRLAAAGVLQMTDSDSVTLPDPALATSWPRLQAWHDADPEAHRLLHRLDEAARDWQASRSAALLWPDPQAVALARRFAAELGSGASDFLAASSAAIAARARRTRALLGSVGAVLLLAAGFSAWQWSVALDARDEARDRRRDAEARSLVARAHQEVGSKRGRTAVPSSARQPTSPAMSRSSTKPTARPRPCRLPARSSVTPTPSPAWSGPRTGPA